MSDGNAVVVFDGPPAPAPEPGPAGHDFGSDNASAELVAAAEFVRGADSRDPAVAQIAAEVNAMLEAGVTGDGDLEQFGDEPSERHRDAQGKFTPRVPHQALHAERLRRKEAEAKAQQLEIQVAKAEERLQLLNDLAYGPADRQQPQQHRDPNAAVDPEIDIFEAVRQLQQNTAQQKQAATYQQLNNAYKADAVEFQKKHPDLVPAYSHLAAARDQELRILGMADPAQRKAQVQQEEASLVMRALQSGESPAQILYNLALAKGWRAPRGAGTQHVFTPAPHAAEQIQNLQRGQAASASLSGHGGTPAEGLSVAQLANMADDQFDRLIKQMGGLNSDRVKRAFGG